MYIYNWNSQCFILLILFFLDNGWMVWLQFMCLFNSFSACLSVSMYASVSVCMYVCVYVYMYVCVCVCVCVCIHQSNSYTNTIFRVYSRKLISFPQNLGNEWRNKKLQYAGWSASGHGLVSLCDNCITGHKRLAPRDLRWSTLLIY